MRDQKLSIEFRQLKSYLFSEKYYLLEYHSNNLKKFYNVKVNNFNLVI